MDNFAAGLFVLVCMQPVEFRSRGAEEPNVGEGNEAGPN
jgi:hypothetical protein